MKLPLSHWLAGGIVGVVLAQACGAAEPSRTTPAAAQRAAGGGRAAAPGRGVLPDPVLLDGSKHTSEKKSEYGMIGDFELPGDENARNGKVGGGPGGNGPQEQTESKGAGNSPQGLPTGGGGSQEQSGKEGAGQGGTQAAQGAGGAPEPKAGEKPGGGGAGDPNAQPQGVKVAELGGDPSGTPQDQGAQQKPAPVVIGDKAMRIPSSTQSVAGVVGAQQVAGQNTQVYEKATGTGGKAPTGPQSPNRVEKGRSIPSGL